ncbi:MAG: hemolysin family protein [Anaerotignaceae bacterium]
MSVSFISIIALIAVYGFLKVLETAFIEININKIKFIADSGNEMYSALYEHLKKIDSLTASIQFGAILCCLCTAVVSIKTFLQPIAEIFVGFGLYSYLAAFFAGAVIIVVLAMLLLLFGNLLPQKIGTRHCENMVFSTIRQITVISAVLSPAVMVCLGLSHLFGKGLGINPREEDDNVTEEEIRFLVDAGEDNGAIDENEKEMINNIFEFNNTMVGDIATHRTDIVAVGLNSTLEDIITVISEEKFSRIPVYDENIDDIIGFFRVRDLLKFYADGSNGKNFRFNDIILEPYFVPFSKKTDELFEDMQKNKVQMAIVIDEYGGTAGIVTMEDLIEEIVGNIFDEYDIDEEEIREIDENTFLVKGTTQIDEVEELFDVEFEDNSYYDTIGGFIIGQLGRIPDEKERPKITVGNLVFKVEKIDDKRIELIKIHKTMEVNI